jgi:hypothetical protein
MSTTVINVPSKDIQDDITNDTNFNTEQEQADIRHTELLCKLDELNDNLKILVTYFALITEQKISKDDT